MHRSGMLSRGGGTRHCAHHSIPHSSQRPTAWSCQCFVQFSNPRPSSPQVARAWSAGPRLADRYHPGSYSVRQEEPPA